MTFVPLLMKESFRGPFNVGPKYGGATLSLNNKEMYVCVYPQWCLPKLDIYRSTLKTKMTTVLFQGVKYDTIISYWTPLEIWDQI